MHSMHAWKGPETVAVSLNPLEAAALTMQTSESQLDLLVLGNESKFWSMYLSELRTFHADTHNDKTNDLQADHYMQINMAVVVHVVHVTPGHRK